MTTTQLRQKYPLIVQWGYELRSFDYYIDNQVMAADFDRAPRTAIYKDHGGQWVTLDDCKWSYERKQPYLDLLDNGYEEAK